MNTCSVGPHPTTDRLKSGWCNKHYKRKQKYGKPDAEVKTYRHKLKNIDREAKTADCVECGPRVPIYVFPNRASAYACVEAQKDSALKTRYNISRDEYNTLLYNQDYKCAICDYEFQNRSEQHLDHDHSCCPGDKSCGECIRGILCDFCNRGLGMFRENRTVLQTAIYYLEHYGVSLSRLPSMEH